MGNVFAVVPGCVAKRIKPDLVHTFHIGFGADLASSIVVWLAKLGTFGGSNFDERLRTAYGMFQEFCHAEKRYTSCEEWCIKKFGMSSSLGVYGFVFPKTMGQWRFQLVTIACVLCNFHVV